MAKHWMAGALVTTALLAGCGGSSGGGSDEPAKATTTAAEATTTTEADLAAVGEEYQTALEAADAGIDDEIEARDAFAADNDLDGGIDSTKDLRNDLFDFDAIVRELDVPAAQESAVNDVLTETGRYIEVLDEYLELTSVGDYNDQLDAESEVRLSWYDAVNALASDLEVDGVENDLDDSGSSSSSDEPASDDPESDYGDTIPAGDTVSTPTASMVVPEGFTGTGFSTIQLTGEDGATAGLYDVYPQGDEDTLEEVAEASATGAAEKNGYEIVAGPRTLKIGEYDAIGYGFNDSETTGIIDFYFEVEDSMGSRWHVFTIEAPGDQIQAASDLIEPSLKTIVIS